MARIIVTGASTGIGAATALQLATAGHDVVATVRSDAAAATLNEAADAHGTSLTIRHLEVTDHGAVQALFTELEAERPLDVLVHNAGAGQVGTLEQLDLAELRDAMEVNFFGAAACVKAAFGPMRQRGRGHIVVVTSVGGAVGQPFNDAYCAAKFAVEGLLESLHPVAKAHGVSVTVVEPGPVATEFIANVKGRAHFAGGDPTDPFGPQRDAYLRRSAATFANAQSSAEVAEVIAKVLTESDPAFRVQTSEAATAFVATKLSDLDGRQVTSMTAGWIAG